MTATPRDDEHVRPLWILIRAIGWDLRLQLRYQIMTMAAVVTLIYAIIFRAVPGASLQEMLVFLIFADPTALGFVFIGVLILFEKRENTFDAVVVTPLTSSQYLWSKGLSLTLIALVCGTGMAIAGRGIGFNPLILATAIILSSLLFVFIGFAAVARVKTVNAYLFIVPMYLAPLNVPLLKLFGVIDSPVLYLFPTQASLILFQRAFEPGAVWELIYGIGFLTVCVAAIFKWALHSFDVYIRSPGGAR